MVFIIWSVDPFTRMYQIEFYSKIREEGYCQCPLLSGIIGDAWAGNVNIKSIDKSSDICNLSYSHGMAGDPSFLIKKLERNY